MQPILTGSYAVFFNDDCYSCLRETLVPGRYSKLFILADSNTSQHCLPAFLPEVVTELPIEIIEIEAGEASKSVDTCVQVWHALTELGADRRSLIINLGGGVVTDLGGFVASTFKRGIDFINVPTSLLAMVDASVGGKTGIDLGVLKNQVGLISNPAAVLVDTRFLDTLPASEMRSGLAEMLKHGLVADKAYWQQLSPLSGLTTDDLNLLVYHSVNIKNSIVEQDPAEKGLRKMLNFGHTLGHAVESHFLETEKPLLHGEAVAAGMVLEAYVSMEKGLLKENEYREIKQVITAVFGTIDFTSETIAAVLQLLVHDKKNEGGRTQFTLLGGIGNAVINQLVENSLIYKAFQDYQN